MRARRALWLLGGAGLALLVGLSFWAPESKWVGLAQDMVSAAAVVGLWVGARRQARVSVRAWTLIALGVTCWVVGDFVWDGYTFLGVGRPGVSIADVFYLGGYPLLAAGLVAMARSRAGRYLREGLLDGCIFGVSATIVVWQFLVVPISGTSSSAFTTAVWSAYPLGDVLLLGAVVWFTFTPGRRSAPTMLLLSSLGTMLAVDVLVSYLPSVSSFDISLLYPLYPISYLLIAAAALHAASAELATAGPPTTRIHPVRFALVGSALCGAAIVAVGPSNTPSTRYVFLALALTICVLVVVRFAAAIRAREVVQEQLLHRSTHDELTGVVNRVLLLDRIAHALERTQRPQTTTAVLYVDLDRFKTINDTYGHDVGDEVLIGAVRHLRTVLRPSDTIGRTGGDEFVILCEDITIRDSIQIAERIIAAIAEPTNLSTLALQVTASVGIAINGEEACTVDTLVRDADTAMYEVKRRGGNSYALYDTRVGAAFQQRRELEHALRDATATGELVLHYHPVVRTHDTTIASFEALLRWRRVDDTLMAPAEFITIAEETGAIVPIGAWVIETACHKLAAWALDGIDEPTIAINVSGLQFRHGALLHDLKRALSRTGADPTRLTLEITESVLVAEHDDVIGQLETIRRLGVRVAIDDFGTGYSGFSYLHRLPVDIIKIDQSLTADLTTDPAASIVVAAIIDLAHALGFEVIAEGAETAEQIERLRALKCDQVQGFYYGQPTTADQADIIARHGLATHQTESSTSST